MSDIDKILRDAIQGYEAPFDASAWENLSSQLSPMEDAFRASVEGHEAPYNPGAWSAIKNQIGSSSTWMQWVAGSAAAIGLVAGIIAFIPGDEEVEVEGISRVKADTNTTLTFTENKNAENELPVYSNYSEASEDNTNENNVSESSENTSETQNQNTNQSNSSDNNTVVSNHVDQNNAEDSNTSNQDNNTTTNSSDNGTASNDAEENDNHTPSETIDLKYSAEFTCSENEVCQGATILFNPRVVKRGVIYAWNFGDGSTSAEATTAHAYTQSGNFEVVLTIYDQNTNKELARYTEQITINELPSAAFTIRKDNDLIPIVNFESKAESYTTMLWRIDGKVVADANEFEYTFKEKGMHTIALEIENADGCVNNGQDQIEVQDDYNLLAPNAFSPNGDNMNETFIPLALNLMDNEFTMTIYHQNGTMVYETRNVNEPWDGSDMNTGSAVPVGAYIWVVNLKNGNGTTEPYKGQVFVTR